MSMYFTKHSLASGVGAWRRQCPGHGAAVIRLTGHIFSWIPKLCVWGNVCGGVDLWMLCAKALCSIGRKRHCCWQASSPRMGLKDVCSCWEPVPLLSLLPSSRGLFEQGHPQHGITRSITMPSPPAFPRQRPPAPGEHQEKTCTAAALLFCFPCPLFCRLCSCKLPIINFITAS